MRSATQLSTLWSLHCLTLSGNKLMLIFEQDIAAISGQFFFIDFGYNICLFLEFPRSFQVLPTIGNGSA